MEWLWHPDNSRIGSLWIGFLVVDREVNLQVLHNECEENEELIPGQRLSHADPLAHSEGDKLLPLLPIQRNRALYQTLEDKVQSVLLVLTISHIIEFTLLSASKQG